MRSRSVLTGFLVAVGSAAGAILLRRRAARRRARAELYFGDGSLVSFVEGSPGADRLLAYARQLLSTARG
jgi:hypothetical protein